MKLMIKRFNKKSLLLVWSLWFITILFKIYIPTSALAFEVSPSFSLADNTAVEGDIISSAPNGLIRSNNPYDNHIFGVVNDDAVTAYKNVNPSPTDHVISQSGVVIVNISDYNGKISPGDYITSSAIPGKGMKATQTGYVIGIAQSQVTEGGQIQSAGKNYTSGQVYVSLRIEYAELSTPRSSLGLLNVIASSIFKNAQDPEKFTLVIKYIMAGLVVVAAFSIGFFAFTRSISKGIEAMGRNPLARKSIQISIIIQVVLTILTLLASIVIALIIIRL